MCRKLFDRSTRSSPKKSSPKKTLSIRLQVTVERDAPALVPSVCSPSQTAGPSGVSQRAGVQRRRKRKRDKKRERARKLGVVLRGDWFTNLPHQDGSASYPSEGQHVLPSLQYHFRVTGKNTKHCTRSHRNGKILFTCGKCDK